MKSFPYVKQHDSMQCGVACLSMICRYYGRYYSLDTVSRYCFATNEGVSMLGIKEAAWELGFSAYGNKVQLDSLRAVPLPCILHWNQNHFVVLYRIRGGRYYVADPAKGLVTYKRGDMERHWLSTNEDGVDKGIAMFILPEANAAPPTDYSNRQRRPLAFLGGYINRYRKYFAVLFAGLLTGCLLQLVMPFLTQWIVDVGIRHKDIGFIWLVLLGELLIVTGRTATDFIRRWILLHISMRINISLVSDFFIKLLKLPMSFFDTKLMGDLLQRIGDHARVQSFLTGQVLSVMFSMLSFLVFGVVLLIYNGLVFSVFIAGSTVYGLWIAHFLSRRRLLDYDLFEQEAINSNRTYQFLTTMQEIKLQGCEKRRRWEWEDTQADLFGVQMRVMKMQQTQEAGSVFINEIKNILITVLAATAVTDGSITLGSMLAIQYIVGQLNSPVEQLMSFIYSLQDVKISLERINEIHDSDNEECREGQLKSFPGVKNIECDDVCFKYDPHATDYTLRHIYFPVLAGKTTAIVGASGSGKTTLIKLMLGYYPATEGTVSISERDIKDYDLKWWRSRCGVVMQDGVIFSDTIARNIAITDGPVSYPRLKQAAQIANIDDFIMELPLKYDTKIGRDGKGLSQGQKQRILIARAVYKNPDYIFLDEATNALDAKNERIIVENLEKFYKNRTVVVVAHRLSTVRNADQILVLDHGQIIERGRHNDLIERKGAYYNLIKNQLELGN